MTRGGQYNYREGAEIVGGVSEVGLRRTLPLNSENSVYIPKYILFFNPKTKNPRSIHNTIVAFIYTTTMSYFSSNL